MIVASVFHGDDWNTLMWAQHDVYNEALGIIIAFASRRYHDARTILSDTTQPIMPVNPSVDHRCLQYFHDYLAAYWRQRFRHTHPDLFCEPETLVPRWLHWLGNALDQCALEDTELVKALIAITATAHRFSSWCLTAPLNPNLSDAEFYEQKREWNRRMNHEEAAVAFAANSRFPVSDIYVNWKPSEPSGS